MRIGIARLLDRAGHLADVSVVSAPAVVSHRSGRQHHRTDTDESPLNVMHRYLRCIRGVEPTCSYRNPSDSRSSFHKYRIRGSLRPGLPLMRTRSPGLKVCAVTPMSESSNRL